VAISVVRLYHFLSITTSKVIPKTIIGSIVNIS